MISPIADKYFSNIYFNSLPIKSLPVCMSRLSAPSFSRGLDFLRGKKFNCLSSVFDFSFQQYFFRLFRLKNGTYIIRGIADGFGLLSGLGSLSGNKKKWHQAKKLGTEDNDKIQKIAQAKKKVALDTLFLGQTIGNVITLFDALKWIRLGRFCRLVGGIGYGAEIVISGTEMLECIKKIKNAEKAPHPKQSFRQQVLSISWRVSLLAASILGCGVMISGLPFFPILTECFLFSGLFFGIGSFFYTIKNDALNGSK